jgi:hypothetical protein
MTRSQWFISLTVVFLLSVFVMSVRIMFAQHNTELYKTNKDITLLDKKLAEVKMLFCSVTSPKNVHLMFEKNVGEYSDKYEKQVTQYLKKR